ncbi:MAG: hypothetical protein ABF335_13050 [Alphaproteobacteria bacterium]
MTALMIWGAALVAYIVFRLWYDNWRGPLKPAEIADFLEIAKQMPDAQSPDGDQFVARMKKTMEEDDGKEFLMVNLLKFNPSPVTHPDTGAQMPAGQLLQEYSKPFIGGLLKRAGHPAIVTRATGGYVEAQNTPADPGWHTMGMVRYRSRRDAMRAALNPEFGRIHPYKLAALDQTFAFPTTPMVAFYLHPRVSVALILALVAALVNLAVI